MEKEICCEGLRDNTVADRPLLVSAVSPVPASAHFRCKIVYNACIPCERMVYYSIGLILACSGVKRSNMLTLLVV